MHITHVFIQIPRITYYFWMKKPSITFHRKVRLHAGRVSYVTLNQEIPAGTLVEQSPLRRSARNRRQPERYQDYDLIHVEIEDALR
jgi:hypothetical protein